MKVSFILFLLQRITMHETRAGSFGHYRDQNLENIGPAMQQYDWMS